MAAKSEIDYPPSPTNEDSGEEETEGLKPKANESELVKGNNNVADILKKLQSTGALVNRPKEEYHCYTCNEDYTKWPEFEKHLLTHVTQTATVVLEKIQDPEDDAAPSDYDWSDEEASQDSPPPAAPAVPSTPKKMDISEILKKTGLSIKRPSEITPPKPTTNSALDKLSGLGLSIKSSSPIKQEITDTDKAKSSTDLMKRLGNLGGIKLKLKSEGINTNSFKVVNGLKHFRTSDDEDALNDDDPKSADEEDESDDEKLVRSKNSISEDEKSLRKSSEEENSSPDKSLGAGKQIRLIKLKISPKKVEPITILKSKQHISNTESDQQAKPVRPSVKQTPRRGANQEAAQTQSGSAHGNATPPSPKSNASPNGPSNTMENIVIKTEVDTDVASLPTPPLFSSQQTIKDERLSPPITQEPIPATATVKTEAEVPPASRPPPQQPQPLIPMPMAIPKQEDTGVTIIEINGDSNDEDDDCCVVSTIPAPDIKPIIPKTEHSYAAYPTSESSYLPPKSSILSSRLMPPLVPSSTSQMNYAQYGVSENKPLCDLGGKGVDDIFDSLFSTQKKENTSINDASEYISLDRLGSQHTCDVCNTRFTSISMLDDHIRLTGHSKSIVTPSTNLMPYNAPSSSLISSLFPVKQLAEQVGKLSTVGHNQGAFTHQQNVMINIQAYPGAGGIPQQPYNAYGASQMPAYQGNGQMYGQGQPMHGSQNYPGANYMGQQQPYVGQSPYDTKSTFPGQMPPGYPGASASYPSSTQSPLQGMQQAVYNQAPTMMQGSGMMTGAGMMGGPVMMPGGITPQTSAPTPTSISMPPPTKPATPTGGIKIKNVQTFAPGQGPIGAVPHQGPIGAVPVQGVVPGQIRGGPPRPRGGITVRGAMRGRGGGPMGSRVRGPAPRMQLKRPMQGSGPAPKRQNMLLPDKNDNEDCQVMAMQKQREGLPMIQRVQGAKAPLNLGSQISITKKTVNREATAMADVLASRGIMVKPKQRSRSPSPSRPPPRIPNLGSDVSVKHASRSSGFSIPEARVGGGMYTCKLCRKMFMNQNSLSAHMSSAHPHTKVNTFKCDECPAAYPKSLQLQHHKRVFHNVVGANRELGLPVVDFAQEENLKRLNSLGIYSYIPLANREHASGCFGIPVISASNVSNGFTNTLQALGADGLLSLGPLKPLPNS